jgi:hypothetical protein
MTDDLHTAIWDSRSAFHGAMFDYKASVSGSATAPLASEKHRT